MGARKKSAQKWVASGCRLGSTAGKTARATANDGE